MQKDDVNTIRFAAIICLICSMALAGVQAALRGIQENNKKIDEQVSVLKALNPSFDPEGNPLSEEDRRDYFLDGNVPREWIPGYFENYVTVQEEGLPDGVKPTKENPAPKFYTLKNADGELQSVAFYAQGKGLWSTVQSYVGLEPDLATIRGVTFFGHQETPGLGGECSKPWFQENFRGKKLWKDGEPVKLVVAKGKAEPVTDHNVDGMSGATITGNGIQKFVNKTFNVYNEGMFENMRAM